jgi:hypothetical protein
LPGFLFFGMFHVEFIGILLSYQVVNNYLIWSKKKK